MAKKTQSKKVQSKKSAAKKVTRAESTGASRGNEGGASARKSAQGRDTQSRLDEAVASVKAGASKGMERMSQEAPKFAAKTSEAAKEGYGKLKQGLSVAYDRGSRLTRDAYREAKEQADRFKNTMEMRKLKSRREELCAELGKAAYSEIVAHGTAAADAFSQDRFVSLIEEIRRVDNEIVEVGKQLEKR